MTRQPARAQLIRYSSDDSQHVREAAVRAIPAAALKGSLPAPPRRGPQGFPSRPSSQRPRLRVRAQRARRGRRTGGTGRADEPAAGLVGAGAARVALGATGACPRARHCTLPAAGRGAGLTRAGRGDWRAGLARGAHGAGLVRQRAGDRAGRVGAAGARAGALAAGRGVSAHGAARRRHEAGLPPGRWTSLCTTPTRLSSTSRCSPRPAPRALLAPRRTWFLPPRSALARL